MSAPPPPSPDPWIPSVFSVQGYKDETEDTFTLSLEGNEEPSFRPGQFNMLYAFGVGEVPISISGSPDEGPLIHTIRNVGLTTAAFHKMRPGDRLGVRGPYGTHWPIENAVGEDVLVVAGGIGLAPLRPVIYHCLHHRSDFGRVIVLSGSRTPDDVLFHVEFPGWRDRGLEVLSTVDTAGADWKGRTGVVTSLIRNVELDPVRTHAFLCGPEIMMRFGLEALMTLGMNEDRIYLSMERNMKCAIGFCGHCQYGPQFICKDGAVFPFATIRDLFYRREI